MFSCCLSDSCVKLRRLRCALPNGQALANCRDHGKVQPSLSVSPLPTIFLKRWRGRLVKTRNYFRVRFIWRDLSFSRQHKHRSHNKLRFLHILHNVFFQIIDCIFPLTYLFAYSTLSVVWKIIKTGLLISIAPASLKISFSRHYYNL